MMEIVFPGIGPQKMLSPSEKVIVIEVGSAVLISSGEEKVVQKIKFDMYNGTTIVTLGDHMPSPNEGHFTQGEFPTSFTSREEALDLQRVARGIVANYVDVHIDRVYVVWFAKTLQNWKTLVSTDIPDGRYYELTHNGDKDETYLDIYQKLDNLVIQS